MKLEPLGPANLPPASSFFRQVTVHFAENVFPTKISKPVMTAKGNTVFHVGYSFLVIPIPEQFKTICFIAICSGGPE